MVVHVPLLCKAMPLYSIQMRRQLFIRPCNMARLFLYTPCNEYEIDSRRPWRMYIIVADAIQNSLASRVKHGIPRCIAAIWIAAISACWFIVDEPHLLRRRSVGRLIVASIMLCLALRYAHIKCPWRHDSDNESIQRTSHFEWNDCLLRYCISFVHSIKLLLIAPDKRNRSFCRHCGMLRNVFKGGRKSNAKTCVRWTLFIGEENKPATNNYAFVGSEIPANGRRCVEWADNNI